MTARLEMKLVFVPRYAHDELLEATQSISGVTVVTASPEDLRQKIRDADILVVGNRSYNADIASILKETPKHLRFIQFSTSGTERALQFGMPPDVLAAAAPGVKAASVAEHAVSLILADFRCHHSSALAQSDAQWRREAINGNCRNLEDATVVIVGLGAIGLDVARKLRAFDCHIVGVSRSVQPSPFLDESIPFAQIDAALARADVVVLCVPATADTDGLIDAARLSRMKTDALLVNVARGELVDEDALVAALADGGIRAAALDVARYEPLASESLLWALPNVRITPHVAGSGRGGGGRFKAILIENLRRLEAGEPLLHAVVQREPS